MRTSTADFRAHAARHADEGSGYAALVLEILDASDDQAAAMESIAGAMLRLLDDPEVVAAAKVWIEEKRGGRS